jgi:signal transduction histidine kinase
MAVNPWEQLREPLAIAYGVAELLLSQPYEDSDRKEMMATILWQLEAMACIVNSAPELPQEGL